MTHDPLCLADPATDNSRCHYCVLIAKVRQDMLDKCIAAVEHLHDHEAPHDAHKDALWNAITALRALQEQP
jgi:hypothetical protein